MSAAVSHVDHDPDHTRPAPDSSDGTAVRTSAVVVRRNAVLSALIGAAASAVGIAYLWRAVGSADPFDWALCALMGLIATFYLAQLVDARTPLMIADDLGIRVRLGHHWRGLPWDAVREVVVQPRRGVLRDGRLAFAPHSLASALEGLDPRGRRAAALNQKAYGAPLAVPMGLSTRVSARGRALAEDLAALAHGRTDVVVTPVRRVDRPADDAADDPGDDPAGTAEADASPGSAQQLRQVPQPREPERPERPEPLGRAGQPEGHVALLSEHRSDVRAGAPAQSDVRPPGSTALVTQPEVRRRRDRLRDANAARDRHPTRRASFRRSFQPSLGSSLGPSLDRSSDAVDRADVEGVRLRQVSLAGESHRVVESSAQPSSRLTTETAIVDDPVIGPELAAARTRVGLSVDELADRTRIRPHVIESIEVDDFGPCGGDFYARGHLRTLARVLGRDPVPLIRAFDNRYAGAPIDARQVFEAELATGMTGSMRSTVGGPSWALMVGVVLALVLTWGVIRLFASEPTEQLQPASMLDGSAGVAGPAVDPAPAPVEVRLVGSLAGSDVVVRDRAGAVVWAGQIAPEDQRTLRVTPPVRIRAETGGAVTVAVNGTDRGLLGQPGAPARGLFHRDAALDTGSSAGPAAGSSAAPTASAGPAAGSTAAPAAPAVPDGAQASPDSGSNPGSDAGPGANPGANRGASPQSGSDASPDAGPDANPGAGSGLPRDAG